jgi:AcrR family transcriptional regulator
VTTRSYHHGDLPRAVRAAALEEIVDHGHSGLSIRAVARRVGVSHAAVFRHFADRDTLLAVLATEGFSRLSDSLGAVHAGDATPKEALHAGVVVYLGFARRHAALYRLMFDGHVDKLQHPDLAVAAASAFSILVRAFERIEDPQPHQTAVMAWATLHGLAILSLDGLMTADAAEAVAVGQEAIGRFARGGPTSDR